MINSLFVRPVLKVTTWIKRNPGLALLLALLLWLLPTPLTAFSWATNLIVGALEKVSGAAASAFLRASTVFLRWLAGAPGRCFWVGVSMLPFSPLTGAAMMFWCAIQALKGPGITLSIFKSDPEPEKISTLPVPVEDDKSDNPFDFGFPRF